MSGRFDIAFNTKIKVVADADRFEKALALDLLDILLGREMACHPDPTPWVDGSSSFEADGRRCGTGKYMIGHTNDFWLYPLGEGRYRVVSRYMEQSTLDHAAALLRWRWRSQLAEGAAEGEGAEA